METRPRWNNVEIFFSGIYNVQFTQENKTYQVPYKYMCAWGKKLGNNVFYKTIIYSVYNNPIKVDHQIFCMIKWIQEAFDIRVLITESNESSP